MNTWPVEHAAHSRALKKASIPRKLYSDADKIFVAHEQLDVVVNVQVKLTTDKDLRSVHHYENSIFHETLFWSSDYFGNVFSQSKLFNFDGRFQLCSQARYTFGTWIFYFRSWRFYVLSNCCDSQPPGTWQLSFRQACQLSIELFYLF